MSEQESKKITTEVLVNVDETLRTAKMGLDILNEKDPAKFQAGLRNFCVFSRAITHVLQKLRSVEPGFEDWYRTYQEEMAKDPLCKHMVKVRNSILKEGKIASAVRFTATGFSTDKMRQAMGPRPPNAVRQFIGDQNGGSGWEVRLGDGSTEKYYMDLPRELGDVSVLFADGPTQHRGKPIEDPTVRTVCNLYYMYLETLVADAKREFLV